MLAYHELILSDGMLEIRPLRQPSRVPLPYLCWDLKSLDGNAHRTFWRRLGCPDTLMKQFFGPTIKETMAAL